MKEEEQEEQNDDDNQDENDHQKQQQQRHLKIAVENCCDPDEHYTVAPAVGRLLIFYDMKEDGTLDPRSSHAGCAVLGDEPKFTITKWMQVGLP